MKAITTPLLVAGMSAQAPEPAMVALTCRGMRTNVKQTNAKARADLHEHPERETLASLGSHQANVPVIPIRQCTKRSAFSRASLLRKQPARLLEAAKRLNFRITQSRSVRLMYRSKGYRADGAYRP